MAKTNKYKKPSYFFFLKYMKYLYILLICLILFYIISRYFEKYYSQENFDPSLVPVSSIITLAKVAQKIVDGNGTLTNPANLNIGTPTGKGNLTVTGDSTTNGNSTVGGNSTTNGNKQIDGTLGVTGATTLSGTLNVADTVNLSGGATILNGLRTNGLYVNTSSGSLGNANIAGTLSVGSSATIGLAGSPATTNNLTVNGASTFGQPTAPTNINIYGSTYTRGPASVAYDGTYVTLSIKPTSAGAVTLGCDNFEFKTSNIGDGTNVKINGGLTVTGALTAGSLNIVPRGCIMMWNSATIPAGWVLCNGQNGTPDMQGRLIQGGTGGAGYGESRETGKGTAGANEDAKNRNSNIYTINFIMKT